MCLVLTKYVQGELGVSGYNQNCQNRAIHALMEPDVSRLKQMLPDRIGCVWIELVVTKCAKIELDVTVHVHIELNVTVHVHIELNVTVHVHIELNVTKCVQIELDVTG
jgi:hypothetical protein